MKNNRRAIKIAKRLLRQNRGTRSKPGRSWRRIIREDYPGGVVKPGTLSRFAVSKGEWVPQDEKILIALGLKKEKKPKDTHRRLSIHDLSAKELATAIKQRDLYQRLEWLRTPSRKS